MPSRPSARLAGARALTCALVVPLLGGCASAVPVSPAEHATDPDCAALLIATPDTLGDGLERRRTTAQASTAWGDPAVVLRCGLEPPGPTTDRCETVGTPGGPSVDWLVVPESAEPAEDAPDEPAAAEPGTGTDWTFVTYGRVPAVEVYVPAAAAAVYSTSFLDALGPAIAAHTEQQRTCL